MTISLFGIENEKKHNFKVEIGNQIIKFWIDSEEVQLKDDCQAIIHQLSDYCNEENDKTFTQRTFFKAFRKFENDTSIVNMIRAFAVSSTSFKLELYTTYHIYDGKKNLNPKSLNDLDFSNQVMIDCDNNLITQPQMFFLKKDLTEKYSQEISELFNSGSLQKFQITDNDKEKVFYYVPFVYNQPTNKRKLWNQIIEDFDAAVKKLANSNQWK